MPVRDENRAAHSLKAKEQMRAQWARHRAETQTELSYSGCHRRIRKERGRAADYRCVQCSGDANQWAHTHETDPTDPQNYEPMCFKCHYAYDEIGARVVATMGPEGRRALAVLAWSRRSPERRAEIGRKIWETRRRNALAGSPPGA